MSSESGGITERWCQSEDIDTSFQSCAPAVAEDHVYIGGLGKTFYALSREDGRIVWSQERDGSMSDSSPCYHDGIVYVGSGGGSIYAFDASNGSVVWRQTGKSAITSSPIVRDGVVYVGRNDGVLWALDADDGSIIFETAVGSSISSKVAYSSAEQKAFVSTADVGVSAHDVTEGGRQMWAQKFGTDVGSSTPVVDDNSGALYFASNEVRALATDDGSVKWGTSFYGASAGSSPVFDDESVYVAGGSGTVYRIPLGEQLLVTNPEWGFQTWDVAIAADPLLVDGTLVFGTLGGNLFVLETESGAQLEQCSLSCEIRGKPAVDGDQLYVAGDGDGIYAFELE